MPARLLDDSASALAADVIARGPQSRPDLAEKLQLSPASMTRLQRHLIARDLINEIATPNDYGSGRPIYVLEPSPTPRTFVGIKLTGDTIYGVTTTLTCHQNAALEYPLESRSPDDVMELTSHVINELCPNPNWVGIALGARCYPDGRIIEAGYLGWENVDAGALLRRHYDGPATFVNDVEAVGRYEQWFGMGRAHENFSTVTIGQGVGHVVIHHGRILHRGDTQLGMIGHLPLDPGSAHTCWLGHHGCAAALLNLDYLTARMRQASPASQLPSYTPGPIPSNTPGISLDPAVNWLHDCLVANAPGAREVLAESFTNVCRLLAIIADVTVAEALSITGELVPLLTWGLGDIDAELDNMRDPVTAPIEWKLRPATFDFWARGAAATAIRAWIPSALA